MQQDIVLSVQRVVWPDWLCGYIVWTRLRLVVPLVLALVTSTLGKMNSNEEL